jgi:hypothetical protein
MHDVAGPTFARVLGFVVPYAALRCRSAGRPIPAGPAANWCQVGRRGGLAPGLELAERPLLGLQGMAAVQGPRLSGGDRIVVNTGSEAVGTQMG